MTWNEVKELETTSCFGYEVFSLRKTGTEIKNVTKIGSRLVWIRHLSSKGRTCVSARLEGRLRRVAPTPLDNRFFSERKSLRSPCTRFGSFYSAIARRGAGFERSETPGSNGCDVVDRSNKSRFVRFRGL